MNNPVYDVEEVVQIEKKEVKPQLLIWMILSQLVSLGSLYIWFIMLGLTMLPYEMGARESAVKALWYIVPYLPVVIIAIIWSWLRYFRQRDRMAGYIMFMPLGYVLGAAGIFLVQLLT